MIKRLWENIIYYFEQRRYYSLRICKECGGYHSEEMSSIYHKDM